MRLTIVVPCYNEEAVLPATAGELSETLDRLVVEGKISASSQVVFVDDGSRDGTWPIVARLARESACFAGIRLSRNRGHQNALLAGLLTVDGDAVASLDADLQDDPAVLGEMLDRLTEGHEIVLGVRRSRTRDSLFKRLTARLFYRLVSWGNRDMVADHADFRLMSRRALEELRRFREVHLYLRGLVTLIGFPVATVEYERRQRAAGETKYPLRKMLAFAFDGISSFTTIPLRLITWIGFLTFLAAIVITAWALFIRVFTGRAIPGWASTVLPLYALGGVQILSVGILGQYLAKIYDEVKRRPRFIVRETTPGFSSVEGPSGRRGADLELGRISG